MRNLIGSRFLLRTLSALLPIASVACGIGHSLANEGTDGGTSSLPGTHDGGPSTPSSPGQPVGPGVPPDPGGPAPEAPGQLAFAIHKVYLGDTDASGVTSPGAWKDFGLNIDGLTTTRDSVNVCRLTQGASTAYQTDGNGGIDNAFGENILPIILTTAGADVSLKINAEIDLGKIGTTLITVRGIGSGPAYSPIGGSLFGTLAPSSPPSWDESDSLSIDSRFVVGGDVNTPRVSFAHGYFSQDTFVSDVIPQATLTLPFFGFPDGQPTEVTHLRVVMTLSADRRTATRGILSGILPTESFIVHMKQIAASISTSLCTGSAFASIAQQVRMAQDILSDGTQDPTRDCDGISFGIGFEANVVSLGGVDSPPPTASVCPPN